MSYVPFDRSRLIDRSAKEAGLPVDTLPEKPAGCVIEESVGPEGVTLSWPKPSRGRFKVAAFLALWLCLWATGWAAAARQLARGGAQPSLIFSLCVSTVAVGLALWMLWLVLRPTRPESVRLEAEVLRYDRGRGPYSAWQGQGWRGQGWQGWYLPPAPKPTPPTQAARSDIRGFVLERVRGRQRLCFDRRADRLEIGAGLREPDRAWLFAVLRRWHSPNTPLQQAGAA